MDSIEIPSGSMYRLHCLVNGRNVIWQEWPDGRPATATVQVRSFPEDWLEELHAAWPQGSSLKHRLRSKTADPRLVRPAACASASSNSQASSAAEALGDSAEFAPSVAEPSPTLRFADTPASFVPASCPSALGFSRSQCETAARDLLALQKEGLNVVLPRSAAQPPRRQIRNETSTCRMSPPASTAQTVTAAGPAETGRALCSDVSASQWERACNDMLELQQDGLTVSLPCCNR